MSRSKVVLLSLCALSSTLIAAPTFTRVGTLPGGSAAYGNGVSSSGPAVVGWSHTTPGTNARALYWTPATGMINLGVFPGGPQSFGHAVSGNGLVAVGEANSSSGLRAFRWTAQSGMVSIGALPGGNHSKATAVNDDGRVVVGESIGPNGQFRAFRWTDSGGMIDLGVLPGGTASYAYGVNNDGSVIVGSTTFGAVEEQRASIWRNGGVEQLPALVGQQRATAVSVSADGMFAVGRSDGPSGQRAVRWNTSELSVQDLGLAPGGSYAEGYTISGDGAIVCAQGNSPRDGRLGLIWHQSIGMRDVNDFLIDRGVNLSGWLLKACSVSVDGRSLTGWGYYNGRPEVWYASIDPFCDLAQFTAHPSGGTLYAGDQITLTSAATSSGTVTYRWKKDGVNLFNSAVYAGVTTPTLTIAPTDPTQSGSYTLAVTNTCGVTTSNAAAVIVRCRADFNDDGSVDFFDYLDFVGAFSQQLPSADINADGEIDFFDYLDFVARLSVGC